MPHAQLLRERVYYTEHRPARSEGELPVVVCIHGAGGSHLNWPAEIRRLLGTRVVVPDLPGHGRSGGDGRQSIDDYAAVMVSFLDVLEVPQAIVVGHSMGGAVALQMALSYPDRVRGLGLIGTGGRLRVAPVILQGIWQDFEGVVRLMAEWAYGPDAPAGLAAAGQQVLAQTPPAVMHGDFAACDAFDIVARLGDIHPPALVVSGTEDCLTPPKYARFLAENIPGAQLVMIERAGHMVMLESPRIVGQALADFVASLHPSRAS